MTEKGLVVAVYANHETAEAAVQELRQAGFDMKMLSIIGKDYHTEETRHRLLQCRRSDEVLGEVGSF